MFPYNTNTNNYYFNFYNRRSWCPRGNVRYNNPHYNNQHYNNPQVDNSYDQQSEVHSPNYWNFNYSRSPYNTDGYYNNFNRHPQFYSNRDQINSNNNFRRGAYNTNRHLIRSTNRQLTKSNSTISLPIINTDTNVLENPESNIENSTTCNKVENVTENFEKNNEDVVDNREVDMEIDSDADTVVLDNDSNLKSTSSLDDNTAVKEKNFDSDVIDSQLRNELNIEVVNKQPNSVQFNREACIRNISNTDRLKKPTRRKSIAGQEFREIRAAKRNVRSASIPSNHDLLSSPIGPTSVITRSKSRQEVPPPPPTKTIGTNKKPLRKDINQDVSSVKFHDKLSKMNIEINVKTEKDNQQPTVDKRSNSTPHSSKSKSQDIKLRLGSSSKGEFLVSDTSKIQAKRKRLEAIFGEDDSNSPPTEKRDTVTTPSSFSKADLKKSSKKLFATPTTSESDTNTPPYNKIKTLTNKKILMICKPNKENVEQNLKLLYTPGLHGIDNEQEENGKMNHNEKHLKKRKRESKSAKKLESSEKRTKSTDDKFVAKNKSEKSDHKRRKEKRSSKKQICDDSNEIKTNKIEEPKEVFISIPEVTNPTEPLLCYQIISPSHVTESTSPLYDDQICIIDLDDLPDDDIHENPMGLLIKSEQPLEDTHSDGPPDLTQDSDIFQVLRESSSVIKTTENEAAVIQTNVEEVACLSDRDYEEEYFLSDALEMNESIAEEIVQHSTILHTPVEFEEVKYIVPEPEADVKPIISKESVILIEDEDTAIEELVKINYSDFAAIFVDDFRYYHYVENSVYQFSIHFNSSTIIDNQNKYSELFESRKLIFERISMTMYNYLKKHEILNFDCHKLIEEINKTCMTKWNTTIPPFKILRFLHNVILTWRKPGNDFIKMFSNNISYNMLLSNEENDNANIRRPNSVISSTSEAVASNSVSTTQTVAAAQTTSEENQQVEQNLRSNHSLISPRPIEQLLANPSISNHQSPLLSSSESQSSNDHENISKQSDCCSQNPKTLYSSTQPHQMINQSTSNQLSLPQSVSRSSALSLPTYEDYQENIKALSRSSTVPPAYWASSLVTPPSSQSQSPPVKRRCKKSRTSKSQNQFSQNAQNLPPTPQCRMPVNNASIDILTYPTSPISHLSHMSQNLIQAPNATSVQQCMQDVSANVGNYQRYANQHSHNLPLSSTQHAQSTFTGNLQTYHPRYPGVYNEQLENRAHQQQSQHQGPQTAATTLAKNLTNTNLYFHGYNLENGTQLQQAAQLQQQQSAQSRLQQIAQSRAVQSQQQAAQLLQQQQAAQLKKQQAAQLQQQQAAQLQQQQAAQLQQQQAAHLQQQQASRAAQQQQQAAQLQQQQQAAQLQQQQQAAQLHQQQQAAKLQQQQAAQFQQQQQAAQLHKQQQAAQLQQQQKAAQLQQQQQAAQMKQQQAAQLQQQRTAQLALQPTAPPQYPNILTNQLLKYPYERVGTQRLTEQYHQRLQSQLSNSKPEIRSTRVAECTSTSRTPDLERNVLDSGTCTSNLVQFNISTNATGSRSCTPPNHLMQNNISVNGSGSNISPNNLIQSSVLPSEVKTYVSANDVVHSNVSGSGNETYTSANNLVQSNVSAIEGETSTTVKIEVPKLMDDIIECIIIEDDDSIASSDDQYLSSPTISSSLTTTTTKTEDVSFFQDNQTCICSNKATHVCACKKAVYCSEDCQAEDWNRHKLICM